MKIGNEEIERLMRVVSESLRLKWENKVNQGHSLIKAAQERNVAINQVSRNCKKSNRILLLLYGLTAAMLVIAITSHGTSGVPWVVVIGSMSFACLKWLDRLENKNQAAREKVETCEEMFARLRESVGSLNFLGQGNPYWDGLGESTVSQRLISAAYRVLAAQDEFESIRVVPNVARHNVIHAGNWIGHCENAFDRIWNTATIDFGLTLDKGEIYRQAAAELAKDKAARASVCG